MGRRTTAMVVSSGLLLVMLALAIALPVPYVALSPGPVFNTLGDVAGKPVITVSGAKTYPTEGQLDATTVYELGGPGSRLSLVQAFAGWLNEAVSVVPSELLHPADQTQEQSQEEGVQQMAFSQQDAVAAALKYLGKPVRQVVQVERVINGAPADGVLKPADRILSVDGTRVTSAEQVRKLISRRKPGTSVTLGILRGDARLTKVVDTEADPSDPSRAVIGIIPGPGYVSPITVTIQLGDVAGPSAGLMFTLAIIDKLSATPLTADSHIAGTGTITPNGRVGPIGGIHQKLYGAAREGATFFLAPAANCDEVVQSIPPELRVVKVKTLDGAVAALQAIKAGTAESLPTCAS